MNVFELIKEKLEEIKDQKTRLIQLTDRDFLRYSYELRFLEKIKEIVNQLAEEYNNGWIPCKQELPKITNSYLVTKKWKNARKPTYETSHEIFWIKDNKWDCERDEDCEWEVTAWQNKLVQYKEGDDEGNESKRKLRGDKKTR